MALAVVVAPAARAQSVNESGLQSLLLPLGARIVGFGGASVAGQFGAESQLANPAALGVATASEVSLLHGQDVIGTRDLVAVVVPSKRLGSFGLSGYLINLAEQAAVDEFGNETGTLYVRTVAAAASYASTIGRDLSVGLTYRVVQARTDCSGSCQISGDELRAATVSMVDLGAQYDFRRYLPLTVGSAVRHLGPRFQIRDSEQADALPTQFVVGARYDVEAIGKQVPDLRLRLASDVSRSFGAGGADVAVHVGAEGMFRNTFALRGGWVQRRGEESGPSVGFGYQSRRIGFDVARQLSGFSVEAGEPPTYVALRYLF